MMLPVGPGFQVQESHLVYLERGIHLLADLNVSLQFQMLESYFIEKMLEQGEPFYMMGNNRQEFSWSEPMKRY